MPPTDAALAAHMARAIEAGTRHVETGGLPFVGVLVDADGRASDHGFNRVDETGDATAHAEIEAMRAELLARGAGDLRDTWLLATGEPCGLCYRFALDQRVERIYVAASSDVAAAWGFDYRSSYAAFAIDRAQLRRDGVVRDLPVAGAEEPFRRFRRRHLPSALTDTMRGRR